jgi:hypothetical protein
MTASRCLDGIDSVATGIWTIEFLARIVHDLQKEFGR